MSNRLTKTFFEAARAKTEKSLREVSSLVKRTEDERNCHHPNRFFADPNKVRNPHINQASKIIDTARDLFTQSMENNQPTLKSKASMNSKCTNSTQSHLTQEPMTPSITK